MWCLDGMEEILERIRLIDPAETRAEEAVRQCRLWAAGEIRMPQAKKAILAAHAIAKESDDPVLGAYAHAIGQGCGSVHCETHAIGMVIYALTALVRAHGLASCQEVIEARVREEEERLRVWQLREKQEKWTWAPFLMKEHPNKEVLSHKTVRFEVPRPQTPAMEFNIVDLPAPLPPITVTKSPGARCSDKSCKATFSLMVPAKNVLWICSTCSIISPPF